MLKTVLTLIVLAIIVFGAYVRLKPIEPETQHVDPLGAARPDHSGFVIVRAGGDIDSPSFEMTAEDLAAKLEAIILDTPRTTHIAGDLTEDFATYVTRSALWGFPDVANVRVIALDENTAEVAIYAHLIYGKADLGANRARVESWLDQLFQD